MSGFDSDRLDSDGLAEVLEMSRRETKLTKAAAGPSTQHSNPPRDDLNSRLASINADIRQVENDIANRQNYLAELLETRDATLNEIRSSRRTRVPDKGKAKQTTNTVDYMTESFEWSGQLQSRMKKVFGINDFRFCQKGVCNANLEGRDIICVMPTGGGKSLTYQLPALLSPGCTLVISPLLALMTDQILHLREANVEAVMLCGTTGKAESNDIYARLSNPPANPEEGIKLCYVTPEKIASNDRFLGLLTKMHAAGRLARIVIDEAHCVSSMGHDFRPDYKKLSKLRTLYPTVPILALSATCPPKVLDDLLKILRLQSITMGDEAEEGKTVYFSAPLYRKNLHYSIFRKPSADKDVISLMSQYILEHHARHTGIVYCFSRQDTQNVADGLRAASGGRIKTGVYHATIPDKDKTDLHEKWRSGDIKVVCATIAFGLGIDKGDVRFVLHHSMSKALEGYYQESGRAGRDGKDSDCILFYRPQDVSRLSGQCHDSPDGTEKVHDMLNFAQDMTQCRKVLFAKHFSASANLSLSSWSTPDSDALANCGHCDNCTRLPESVTTKDVTLEAWTILKVAQEARRQNARVTLASLAGLVKGSGAIECGKGKHKEKVHLDLDDIVGGKVELTKEDAEVVIVELLIKGYLKEEIVQTSYKSQVYLVTSSQATRLTMRSREDIRSGTTNRIMSSFLLKSKKARAVKPVLNKFKDAKVSSTPLSFVKTPRKITGKSLGKRTHEEIEITDDEGQDADIDDMYVDDDDLDLDGFIVQDDQELEKDGKARSNPLRSSTSAQDEEIHSDDEDWEAYDWANSLRADAPVSKKARISPPSTRKKAHTVKADDIICLSSD